MIKVHDLPLLEKEKELRLMKLEPRAPQQFNRDLHVRQKKPNKQKKL